MPPWEKYQSTESAGPWSKYGQATPAPAAEEPAQPASLMDKVVGSAAGRTVLGMASPLIGAAQAGAHVGDAINRMTGTDPVISPWLDKQLKELEASKKRGMESYGHEPDSVDWMGMIGSFLPGAAMAKGVASALPAATGPAGRAGVAALQGATVGASQPSQGEDFAGEKMLQGGLGAVFGGIGSLGTDLAESGAKIVGDIVRPLTEKGRAKILDLFQQSKVPENAREVVAKALSTGKEIVPGSKPTAGELVAHVPEATSLASHQATLERMSNPVALAPQFAARRGAQEGAREGMIQSFAKTPQDLEAALKTRKDVAGALYKQAFETPVKKAIPDEILANPYVKDAMPDALKLAEASGFKPTQDNITQFGHYLKIGMDKQLSRTGDGALHDTEKKAVGAAKEKLVEWMTKNNDPYAKAKSEFVRLSQEPNQMQVGQVLEDALRSPLGTKERGTVFANAMNNAPNTIKKATGQRVHDDLDKILTPENKQKADAVMKDLARFDQYKNLSRMSSGGGEAIPGNIEPSLPNILSRPAMIANFIMKKVGEGAEEKMAKAAARRYLDDPEAIARALLRSDQPARYQQIIDALMRQAPVVGGIVAGQAGRN